MPSSFPYALCNELFGDWPLEKVFDFTAECGYTGVEIAPFTIGRLATEVSAKRRAEVRRTAERAGLKIIGLHWLLAKTEGFHLTTADADVRRKTAAYFADLARFCGDLGGTIMVLGSPKQRDLEPGMRKEQGMRNAAEVLLAAAPVMEKTGVVMALESLAKVETNFLTTADESMELVRQVDSPTCRLHLDCKAMAGEERPDMDSFDNIPALIRKYRDVTVHFHANDVNRQGPGFGKIDFVPIMKALREVEYSGWVSVEPLDYTPGAERLARESIAYLKDCDAQG
jgi:sugar phosphate isomerase/epimerase